MYLFGATGRVRAIIYIDMKERDDVEHTKDFCAAAGVYVYIYLRSHPGVCRRHKETICGLQCRGNNGVCIMWGVGVDPHSALVSTTSREIDEHRPMSSSSTTL